MRLSVLDWATVAAYMLLNLAIGFYYRKKASSNTGEYFVSGREVGWLVAGTSMVAATFAADTPLAFTGLVASQGIAGLWLSWCLALNGMMTVFFFARLWRRAEVITDAEFAEIRYAGKPAAFLRGFRAVYFGVVMNCLIIGWVSLAMEKILQITLNISRDESLAIVLALMAFTGFYTSISGLWGVLWTDVVQFVLKMGMVVLLAYFAVEAVGGIANMNAKLAVVDAARRASQGGSGSILSFIPELHSPWMPFLAFCVFISVVWWANWFPGAEPGGGGFVAQRMFSAKDEQNSLKATAWFQFAHHALRTWPWVLTALASVVLYPHLKDPEVGYVKVWVDYLPPAFRGLMFAAFLAAYMSTIGTELNWGSSYLINDFYRRFVVSGEKELHYVWASKLATVLLAIAGAIVSLYMQTVAGAWELMLAMGAGTGAVYLLRWYWWRINAWSEVSAMTAAALATIIIRTWVHFMGPSMDVFAKQVLLTVVITTLVWLAVTLVTRPEPEHKLLEFYRRVRPGSLGWKRVSKLAPEISPATDIWRNSWNWIFGSAMVYTATFGIGKLVLGSPWFGTMLLVLSAVCGYAIRWDYSRDGGGIPSAARAVDQFSPTG
jgi:solute:Na+ symporter, SSS family